MNDEYQEDVFTDPAEHHPLLRLTIRYITLLFLFFLALFIPALTFYFFSILLHLSTTIGTLLGVLSFILYLYVFWKKELWNLIKR